MFQSHILFPIRVAPLTGMTSSTRSHQVAGMLGLDVMALVSFDQVQVTDPTWLSLTYWTLVGAYTIPSERNSTSTLLDAAVFDVKSHHLLFRAPGTSVVASRAPVMEVGGTLHSNSNAGFRVAATNLAANLNVQLNEFQRRVRENPGEVEIVRSPGYRGGAGGFGMLEVPILCLLGWLMWRMESTPETEAE